MLQLKNSHIIQFILSLLMKPEKLLCLHLLFTESSQKRNQSTIAKVKRALGKITKIQINEIQKKLKITKKISHLDKKLKINGEKYYQYFLDPTQAISDFNV